MAGRVDPFGDKIDWVMEVATEYQRTRCLPSQDKQNTDEKLSKYVRKVLQSWEKNGISCSANKPLSDQVYDIAMYAGILIARPSPEKGDSIKKIEAFYDDHLDFVESLYEKKIQPLKKNLQKKPELLDGLQTVEVRVEMYAEKHGLILKRTDILPIEDEEISDNRMIGEIFDLELPLDEPIIIPEENEVEIQRSLNLNSIRLNTPEPQTDVESANVSEMSSPNRARRCSDSPDPLGKSISGNESNDNTRKALSSLFQTIVIIDRKPEEVLMKKERISWIDVPKEITSELTQEIIHPIPRTFPSAIRSHKFLKESALPKSLVALSAPAVLEPSIMGTLDLPKGSIPRNVWDVEMKEAWNPVESPEEDTLFKIEL